MAEQKDSTTDREADEQDEVKQDEVEDLDAVDPDRVPPSARRELGSLLDIDRHCLDV